MPFPVLLLTLFLCVECFDFEAAATHEVGHILGLGHPDLATAELVPDCAPGLCGPAGQDVRLAPWARMDNVTCIESFKHVVARPADEEVRPAIMISFTQHNPTVCLGADDLEALYALYPDCQTAISDPVCFKTKHNIGWVRLGVYFLVPCILALFLAMCAAACTAKQQKKRLASARNLLQRKSSVIGRAMCRLSQVQTEASRLREERDVQRATEESRIEAQVEARLSRASRASRHSRHSRASSACSEDDGPPPTTESSSTPLRALQRGGEGSLRYLGAMVDSGVGSARRVMGMQRVTATPCTARIPAAPIVARRDDVNLHSESPRHARESRATSLVSDRL